MKRTIKKKRNSAVISLLVAAIPFPFSWAAGVFVAFEIVRALVASGAMKSLQWIPKIDLLSVCAVIGLPVIPAYWFSRIIYMSVRWKEVEDDGSCCWQCGYDLTGNESGVCPECGQRVTTAVKRCDDG